ncbi:hypothetical protein CFP65_0427 [Kitasatospora sp. MMS16-BH015]|uniref:hypothetical protein n=1 Tax=Kitasatospora sp. MMS16-BH015 TaxID=2018025 RepID=UPI000CA1AC58|nr:hypothetical protein [Kitasatospora sp. MMS16-BH015]AUG75391.1 hypothetical protein CFP65_0427 [Kitasatospora sp. MMS16-BH015]
MLKHLLPAREPAGAPSPGPASSSIEVTPRPVDIKCMGRRYRATGADGTLTITDVTDITRPVRLGTAHPDGAGTWQVRTARRSCRTPARDLADAIALLHEIAWPTRPLWPQGPS